MDPLSTGVHAKGWVRWVNVEALIKRHQVAGKWSSQYFLRCDVPLPRLGRKAALSRKVAGGWVRVELRRLTDFADAGGVVER